MNNILKHSADNFPTRGAMAEAVTELCYAAEDEAEALLKVKGYLLSLVKASDDTEQTELVLDTLCFNWATKLCTLCFSGIHEQFAVQITNFYSVAKQHNVMAKGVK